MLVCEFESILDINSSTFIWYCAYFLSKQKT